MSIEKLLERINKDATEKAKNIKKEAQKEAQAILNEANRDAKENKKKRLGEAGKKAEIEKEAALAKARLDARDITLLIKRTILNKAFKNALDKTNNISAQDYEKLVLKLLVDNSKGTEKVMMADAIAPKIVSKANELLKESQKTAQLKVSDKKIKDKGFILVDEQGSRTDFTLKSLVDFQAQELEAEVFSILMKENGK